MPPAVKFLRLTRFALLSAAMTSAFRAQAGPVAFFDINSFLGSAQVINFNSIGQNIQITNQFSGQGVTFSGASLFGSTNSGDLAMFSNSGGVIATTWTGSPANSPWVATFTVPQQQVGFYVEMNSGDSVALTTNFDSTPTGTVSYLSIGTTAVFFGVQDLGAFNSISVTVTGSDNHFFAMDDFRYVAIPEPGVTSLLAASQCLAALVPLRRRFRRY